MDEGYDANAARQFHDDWYHKWPGTTGKAPLSKKYSELLIAEAAKQASEREQQEMDLWVRNADFRAMEARDAEFARQRVENAAQLLKEREAANQPPIHCNCVDENGEYLPATITGHHSIQSCWFRCHHFKLEDENYPQGKFQSECGFEIRAEDIDNMAPQPPITQEQCQKVMVEEPKGSHPLSSFAGFDLNSMMSRERDGVF